MTDLPATVMVPLPCAGRRFEAHRTVRLGDIDPAGSLRFDAIGRYLQDVANDDAHDAALDDAMGWVVRRTMIEVRRPATFGESLTLVTFCSGSGRSWAERRTSITGDDGAHVETVTLWVRVDAETGRPAALDDDFHRIYGEASGGRRVSSRRSLPDPSTTVSSSTWTFRRSDLDLFDHVNNAAQWSVLEELLAAPERTSADGHISRVGVAELEFARPVQAGEPAGLVVDDGPPLGCWLLTDGAVSSAIRFASA